MKISKLTKIGLFTIATLAFAVWGVNFLKGRDLFTSSNVYFTIFNSVDGLVKTNKVMLSGYKVGVVKDIQFEEGHTGRLIVTLLIEGEHRIPHNTIAKLISTDFMGGKAIKLEVSRSNTFYEPKDTIPSSIETGLIDQLGHQMVPVKEKAESLMDEMDRTLETIGKVFNEQNRDNLNNSFVSLRNTLANLDNTTRSLDTMMNAQSGSLRKVINNVNSISRNLRNNNEQISNVIRNFSTISDSLAKVNFATTITKADSAMRNFNVVLDKINKGEGTMGQLINNDSLYRNLDNASRNLDLLLIDMKANPKRYVNFSVFDFGKKR